VTLVRYLHLLAMAFFVGGQLFLVAVASNELKPVVTLAALYGAGDSVIGPRAACAANPSGWTKISRQAALSTTATGDRTGGHRDSTYTSA
jgi:hypothetical protein